LGVFQDGVGDFKRAKRAFCVLSLSCIGHSRHIFFRVEVKSDENADGLRVKFTHVAKLVIFERLSEFGSAVHNERALANNRLPVAERYW